MQLIECALNISEGRDLSKIEAITRAGQVNGAKVLHVDVGSGAARTVITVAGEPTSIEDAAYRIIHEAANLIDMRNYRSVHPCIGAADVCPFVPLKNATIQDCITCAHSLAKRVATELGIPVYLYGAAAQDPARRALSTLRKGGYRGLAQRFQTGELPPDYGGPCFNPSSGAIAIGARDILIAFNINLATTSETTAKKIAARIRSSAPPSEIGPYRLPLPHCQAIGWYIDEYGFAQVSTNLTAYQVTPPHQLFQAVEALAKEAGTSVTGSELIGLIPKGALLAAGLYYKNTTTRTEDSLIDTAIEKLGLHSLRPFDRKERILEEALNHAGWGVCP